VGKWDDGIQFLGVGPVSRGNYFKSRRASLLQLFEPY